MKKKTSVLLLLISAALLIISTVILVLSVFGSTNFTDIRADLQGVSAVYIDDEAESIYTYGTSITKRSFGGEPITAYSFGESEPRVNEITVQGDFLYASLLDERKIVSFDEQTGAPGKVYRILDPITEFVIDGQNK